MKVKEHSTLSQRSAFWRAWMAHGGYRAQHTYTGVRS
jgi:hypothetical protein